MKPVLQSEREDLDSRALCQERRSQWPIVPTATPTTSTALVTGAASSAKEPAEATFSPWSSRMLPASNTHSLAENATAQDSARPVAVLTRSNRAFGSATHHHGRCENTGRPERSKRTAPCRTSDYAHPQPSNPGASPRAIASEHQPPSANRHNLESAPQRLPGKHSQEGQP